MEEDLTLHRAQEEKALGGQAAVLLPAVQEVLPDHQGQADPELLVQEVHTNREKTTPGRKVRSSILLRFFLELS